MPAKEPVHSHLTVGLASLALFSDGRAAAALLTVGFAAVPVSCPWVASPLLFSPILERVYCKSTTSPEVSVEHPQVMRVTFDGYYGMPSSVSHPAATRQIENGTVRDEIRSSLSVPTVAHRQSQVLASGMRNRLLPDGQPPDPASTSLGDPIQSPSGDASIPAASSFPGEQSTRYAFVDMANNDKEAAAEGATPRGADWEVVTLTASAYAVAPGPGGAGDRPAAETKSLDASQEGQGSENTLFMREQGCLPNLTHNVDRAGRVAAVLFKS
uniref:Uncharacterized protein n=1 Tax=Oryza glumipatula TaxID=40148 RepID=A0A0D9Y8U7_9ORYZ